MRYLSLFFLPLALGCGDNFATAHDGAGGQGGAPDDGTGGAGPSGGTASATGGAASGGAVTGGAGPTGGTASGGAGTGGVVTTGGTSSGGAPATGGLAGVGGYVDIGDVRCAPEPAGDSICEDHFDSRPRWFTCSKDLAMASVADIPSCQPSKTAYPFTSTAPSATWCCP